MGIVLSGIQIGLALSILLGPIFFALIQAGVEQGIRAGTMVGAGIWISDILFILMVYFSANYITEIVASDYFVSVLGYGGFLILVVVGLGTLMSKPPSLADQDNPDIRNATYWALWLKGFLINTINPFTFFFWISMMSTVVIDGDYSRQQALLFFGSILATIIVTDFTKVVLAKQIRRWLKDKHILLLRRISGSALIIFGVVLLIRVLIN